MVKVVKNNFGNFLVVLVIFTLVTGWVFSGWPQIWRNPPIPPEVQVAKAAVQEYFSSSGNFTAQVTGNHTITLVGGGGGGGGSGGSFYYGGGGGGGGGLCQVTVSFTKGQQYSWVVGVAGAAGGAGDGGTGGNTTFTVGGTTYIAYSGTGGLAYDTGATGGPGGATSLNCDLNRTGGTGGTGTTLGSSGGGSGAGTSNNGNPGSVPNGGAAVSDYGGKGGDGTLVKNANGVAGEAYGGGGGGGAGKAGTGAAGYAGYIRITYNTPPTFTAGPDDDPDPVSPGNDVTFLGTATDGENNNWYLAVCKTDSVATGIPPTCDIDQTYCISSSTVASNSQNTCTWNATGTGAQTYYAFACDNDVTYGPQCSPSSSSTVTIGVPEVSCSVSATSTAFGLLTASEVSTSTPNINVSMSCTDTASGCTLSVQGTGSSTEPGLWNSGASHLIASSDTTLSLGTEGYGIQATSSDGGWTLSPKYLVTGNQVGGLTIAMTTLASSTEDISTSTVTVTHKAARSASTPTGSYQDSIVYSCTPN
ncbi:MAG TPA: hypothetical protein VMV66_01620 [Candidatus Humimicrobiaceae bacterium]|nr:hypothetical protein [Candidatus Humimicrobiaceae bacterium]